MPLTLDPETPPASLDEALTGLIEDAMRVHTQWNPNYETDTVTAIHNAISTLLNADDLTPEIVNARIEGMRGTLFQLREGLEINGTRYDSLAYTSAP